MRRVKLGAAAVNQTPMDWQANRANICRAIDEAYRQEVKLLCLPEMAITGYGCEDQFHSQDLLKRAMDECIYIAAYADKMDVAVAVGLPVAHGGSVYNCVAFCSGAGIHGIVPKQNLANDGLHYELRWFKPWKSGEVSEVSIGVGPLVPFGDLIFDLGGIRVGFEICEDAWVSNRTGASLARRNVDIILNPSASHFSFGKSESRKRIVADGSRSLHAAYVYTNLLGNEAGRIIYEGDRIIATNGQIVADGERFSSSYWEVTSAIVDIDINRLSRARQGSFVPQRDSYIRVFKDFTEPDGPTNPPIILNATDKFQEFTQAVTLGLRDYMLKTHTTGYVVSLSGGADSSACACLVKIMADRFGMPVKDILTCIYQGTEHSSQTTLNAAQGLAKALGAEFHNFHVQPVLNEYLGLVSKAITRELTWEQDDIALQNIQARIRAPGVWMIANIKNALLLATSNRSEAAVGYATMDGDTCGGLSPLAGIDKAFLLQWLKWYQDTYNERAMQAIVRQQPTAELRPQEQEQKDEEDLMPYSVLDEIEEMAIRDKKSPLEIFCALQNKHNPHNLSKWITKFFQLWSRNQWKRERYAPSFHLDDESLDPKTWCRFPILSSGFATEVTEMREYANKLIEESI